jgi:hypothetical protein
MYFCVNNDTLAAQVLFPTGLAFMEVSTFLETHKTLVIIIIIVATLSI